MQINYQNYRLHLGTTGQEKFKVMADRAYGRAIVLVNGILRYANIDEA